MAIGQEVGVTPLQIISMVSSIANDGIYTPPRIVADVTPPTQGYRQIVFHPKEQHRVISSMTAAQMRSMMQEVVLEGTARRAILNGYSAAGKTGTAQKVDPKTHLYSKTDYVGSFVGFAPVNNPALTVAVILDSAKGLHQGGQVSAPVFNRIMQQSLEYLNVPHDTEIRDDPKRQLMMANVKDSDLEEGGALDREGPGVDLAEAEAPTPTMTAAAVPATAAAGSGVHMMPSTALAATPVTAGGTLPDPSPSSVPARMRGIQWQARERVFSLADPAPHGGISLEVKAAFMREPRIGEQRDSASENVSPTRNRLAASCLPFAPARHNRVDLSGSRSEACWPR